MTIKKCDQCDRIIPKSRLIIYGKIWIGTADEIDTGNQISLMQDDEDFCSSACVIKYLNGSLDKKEPK